VLAGTVGAGEEMVFAPECNRAEGALDDIGVDFYAAVIEESNKAVPAREGVTDSADHGDLLYDDRGLPG
jgi:hypothetical protein